MSTHAFDRIGDLRQSSLLSNLLLNCYKGGFIYPGLSCEISLSLLAAGQNNGVRTIVVVPILTVAANGKV